MRTLCKTSISLTYTVSFLNETDRQVVIEQTRFLGAVFLCSVFKLENIILLWSKFFAGKMFAVIFICGNLFCGSLEKSHE